MAIAVALDPPPKPPPATVPMTDTAWVQYFTDLYYWQVKLAKALS